MKKILLLCLIILPLFAWADSWEDFTKEEAEAIQETLAKNPYILDYCDCCEGEARLLRVKSTKIVPCSYDNQKVSVIAQVEVISHIPIIDDQGLALESENIRAPEEEPKHDEYTIAANYTWLYDKNRQKGVPLYLLVPYKTQSTIKTNSGYCLPFTDYPTPKYVNHKGYRKWYRKYISK